MKVLFVLTNHTELGNTGKKTGYFLREVAYPYSIIKKAGHEITFCSPSGGPVHADPLSLDYGDDEIIINFYENDNIKDELSKTNKPELIDSRDFRCIVFAGGHGTMWDFSDCNKLQLIAREIYENNGLIAAICHGPAIFANLKLSDGKFLVSGKKISCFTDDEEKHLKLKCNLSITIPYSFEGSLLYLLEQQKAQIIDREYTEIVNITATLLVEHSSFVSNEIIERTSGKGIIKKSKDFWA